MKYLSSLVVAAPTYIFCSTYLYSWFFYRKFLGNYNFLVGINDHITKGSSVLPFIFLSLISISIGWAFDLRNNPDSTLKEKDLALLSLEELRRLRQKINRKMNFLAAVIILGVIYLAAECSLLIYNDQFFASTAVFLASSWLVVTLKFPSKTRVFLFRKFLIFVAAAGLAISASKGYDDASKLLSRQRHEINRFVVGNDTTEASLMATLAGAHIIRAENGDFFLRYFENKESIFLFNYIRPPEKYYASVLQYIFGFPPFDR
jgi:hypothetical protein